MIVHEEERRSSQRIAVHRSCKVHDLRTGKYYAGTTCNVMPGGILLRIDRTLPLSPGDDVSIAIAPRRHAILRQDDFQRGTIVRRIASPGETLIAVSFPVVGGAVRTERWAA